MLFATTRVAARIERAAAHLMQESTEAVGRKRPDADVFARALSGGAATYAGPGSPLNKVAGLGFEGAVDEGELEDIENLYASRDEHVQIELSCLADPSLGSTLTGRGYTLVGFENVLGRTLSQPGSPLRYPPGAENSDIVVEGSDEDGLDTWLDTVVTGFMTPDTEGLPPHESFPREALERVMRDMAGARGFVRYLALRAGAPAGGGSMYLGDGVAQMCGAATLPAHRRRGVQTALLSHRLSEAARQGCDIAVVTTQPGSPSQKNVQKKGFELLYARAVLVRTAA